MELPSMGNVAVEVVDVCNAHNKAHKFATKNVAGLGKKNRAS